MRREEPKENLARSSFIFLWQKCECCEKEIRLERVWKFSVNSFFLTLSYSNYIACKDCLPTMDEANKFIHAFTIVKMEPNHPPMPKCKPPRGSRAQSQQVQQKQCEIPEIPIPDGFRCILEPDEGRPRS